jgi:hypothetical protein
MDSPLFKCKACDHTATQFIPFVYEGWESILHEKKIQQVKPLLGIKRQNTDWATIVLRRLYQNETLKRLLEVKRPSEQSKEPDILEGAVKVYKSREEVDKALKSNLPLSALKLGNNSIHMVYRESQQVHLLEICFHDAEGHQVCDICWCSPISTTHNLNPFDSMTQIQAITEQYILLLPVLDNKGTEYVNSYHAISNKWLERTQSGLFKPTAIPEQLFQDWI